MSTCPWSFRDWLSFYHRPLLTSLPENISFLHGPEKKFHVLTGLVMVGQYNHLEGTQAILVEVDEGAATYKTYLVSDPGMKLEDALESLHIKTRKMIYNKFAESLEENAMIEAGETVLEGQLEW